MKKQKKPNTIWNILALVTVLAGGAATLLLSWAFMQNWATSSGLRFPIGHWAEVDLDVGEYVVYYESPQGVPTAWKLDAFDPYGERIHPPRVSDEEMYRLLIGGWSGRGIGILRVEEAGAYRLRTNNTSLQDEDISSMDQMVLAKSPALWTEAAQIRKQILMIGASITFTLVVIFYILHGMALRARARKFPPEDLRLKEIDQTVDVAV